MKLKFLTLTVFLLTASSAADSYSNELIRKITQSIPRYNGNQFNHLITPPTVQATIYKSDCQSHTFDSLISKEYRYQLARPPPPKCKEMFSVRNIHRNMHKYGREFLQNADMYLLKLNPRTRNRGYVRSRSFDEYELSSLSRKMSLNNLKRLQADMRHNTNGYERISDG